MMQDEPETVRLAPELDDALRAAVERAAECATDVDVHARFPAEAIEALRAGGLLSAVAPRELGGPGLSTMELVAVAGRLARGCGAAAMIWAMHQSQLACLARHQPSSRLLRSAIAEQWLIASVTSEEGTGGDLHNSHASVDDYTAGRYALRKSGPTISYGAFANAFLVTARRNDASTGHDQVAVLTTKEQTRLKQTGEWNTLGMRGTCSPSFELYAEFDADQILPVPFRDVAADTMIPLSHLLWAAVWTGLAAEAVHRASALCRSRARTDGFRVPQELALAHARLVGMRAQLAMTARAAALVIDGGRRPTITLTTELNALKTAVSEGTVEAAQLALRVCGMVGLSEDGPYSIARILRDAHTAPLMIRNSRLLAANAQTLLLVRGE